MIENRVVVFAEDFADMPIGVLRGDYTPAGEYHVSPILSAPGRWRETVLHHSYRDSHGNWQVVREVDGAHVLEQTYLPKVCEPMLAAGEPHWRDVVVEVGLRALSEGGWRAVVFRYRHARRFYAAVFAEGMVKVIRRDNDVDTLLGEAACVLNPDRYQAVHIACEGAAVAVSVDGQVLVSCADDTPGAFLEGCLALAATDVTRFRAIRVQAAAASVAAADGERQATAALQARHPQPRLWRRIATPRWGTDRNLRMGDLNGDGQAEIVLARATGRRDADSYYSITSLAAYDLEGNQLWTIGEPDAGTRHTTGDLCFQVHDIDGDGRAEVLFCRDFEFCIADGATGEITHRMPMPRRYPTPVRPLGLYRHFGDSMLFCDLTGSGRPDCIVLKDRYKSAWAFDNNLQPLWEFFGNLGHYPYARDIDGDGRDELAFGYHLLDHDGTELWRQEFIDHADNIAIVDLPDGTAVEPRVLVAASDAGFYLLDLQGNVRAHYPIGHGQSLCVANLLPEREGLEIIVNTFWGAAGITAVFDEQGRLLHDFEPMPYACLLQPVNWVPVQGGARPADLVLLSAHPQQGGLIDGYGRRAVVFPDDGHPTLCSDARDVDGDGIDEVLTWDAGAIWIYKADVPGRTPANYPRRNPWYNDSNYRAQISLPVA